jgi:excisionase family DNA binding protein
MSETISQESNWITPEELAARLSISPGTVANWRGQGKGPAFKRFGGIVRYREDIVNAWIEAQPNK